jgi:hypothetical protein
MTRRFPIFLPLAVSLAAAHAEEAPDFTRDIRPVLEKRCFECHGEKKQKGGLRLDRKADILRGGDSDRAPFVAGKSAESEMLKRVMSDDDDEKMPPKGERLAAEQVEKLRAWIDAGAVIPDDASMNVAKHWAYVKPAATALPEVKNAAWCRNGIDRWVLARLEREGLKPSVEADRAVLLRRVTLDLTGLPPTLEEASAFEKDEAPDAYEKVVDRLLASPAYGERWARPWLDLARYADTQGYEKDNRRSMWPWRDWVISAFNRDVPFDRFTIEQIAGDMLPGATQEQRIATGFHRNTMTNTEGGTDNEEFRYEALVDRVNTTFGAWMGTTFNCAQCHNHKYDPFKTTEYYQVMAFLNNTEDADYDDEKPTMKVFAPGQREQLDQLRSKQREEEKKADDFAATPEFAAAQSAWEERAAAAAKWEALEIIAMKSEAGATLAKTEDGAVRASGESAAQDNYVITTKTMLKGITAFRVEALTDDSLPKKGPGRSVDGNIILTEFKVTADGLPVTLKGASADFQQEGWPVAAAIDGKPETGWAWAPRFGKAHLATFTTEKPIADGRETTIVFRLEHQNHQWSQHVLGKFRIMASTSADPNLTVPAEIAAILVEPAEKRNDRQKARLREQYRTISPEMKPLAAAVGAAKKAADDFEKALPITSVMAELAKPRVTKRHVRGAYLSTAEEVQAATPAALHAFPADAPRNRLGFARWLVDRENPLTARVIVNRFWEQYFGKGIVETVEEFGKQGEAPSHPELLDWLAVQFMDGCGSGTPWSMKALHKLIVTSATYGQSSRVSPALVQRDPFNRLLARGPRVRLEAEMIRDQALAVSGLLSHKIGGPSVMPPQPDGIWQVVYSGDKWETSKGEDKYRRGLYTFWRRSSPHPMMSSFDAPTREFCVLRRSRSDTPLQALDTLNDPAFVEAAQALARRIAAQAGDVKERAAFAFRTCLSRAPKPEEIERISKLYERELANYTDKPGDAEKMAASETPKPKDCNNLPELAAWTVVANVLLNLDEAITKG